MRIAAALLLAALVVIPEVVEGQALGGVTLPAGGRAGGPPRPAPRRADGRILLQGATPQEKGVWLPGPGITGVPIKKIEELPMQPWARAVFADRQVQEFEPHTRCKPSGVARQFQTPYGVEFVELAELQRIYIFDIGGPHSYRTIYMDGRSQPPNVVRSAYGHSVGWWEGDSLVVSTSGFHEGFWLDRKGLPHTEKLRTLERFTRVNATTIQYQVTVDDPGAYTEPWTTQVNLVWEGNTELFEYVCQQANYAHELMVGGMQSVSRFSPIVP